jgi:hypothetical protein
MNRRTALVVFLYLIVFPAIGALVGYVFYVVAKLLGRNVGEEELYLFVVVWTGFFACWGVTALIKLLKAVVPKTKGGPKTST